MVSTQVLAFRKDRLLVVADLDESYAEKSAPTIFGKAQLPDNLSVWRTCDVRPPRRAVCVSLRLGMDQ